MTPSASLIKPGRNHLSADRDLSCVSVTTPVPNSTSNTNTAKNVGAITCRTFNMRSVKSNKSRLIWSIVSLMNQQNAHSGGSKLKYPTSTDIVETTSNNTKKTSTRAPINKLKSELATSNE